MPGNYSMRPGWEGNSGELVQGNSPLFMACSLSTGGRANGPECFLVHADWFLPLG